MFSCVVVAVGSFCYQSTHIDEYPRDIVHFLFVCFVAPSEAFSGALPPAETDFSCAFSCELDWESLLGKARQRRYRTEGEKKTSVAAS